MLPNHLLPVAVVIVFGGAVVSAAMAAVAIALATYLVVAAMLVGAVWSMVTRARERQIQDAKLTKQIRAAQEAQIASRL